MEPFRASGALSDHSLWGASNGLGHALGLGADCYSAWQSWLALDDEWEGVSLVVGRDSSRDMAADVNTLAGVGAAVSQILLP